MVRQKEDQCRITTRSFQINNVLFHTQTFSLLQALQVWDYPSS